MCAAARSLVVALALLAGAAPARAGEGGAPGGAPADASLVRLAFVGDVSFAGRPAPRDAATAKGAANPLRAFAGVFGAADLAVANLEGLLTAEAPEAYGESRLNIGARPVWAGVFAAAGVGLVGLANNHTWDGGADGLREHVGHVAATGVPTMGAGADDAAARAPFVLEREGGCVALLPATLKSNRPPRAGAAAAYYKGDDGLAALVAAARAQRERGCFVVVYVHWGREAVDAPPASVVAAAHALVDDGGAGLVVGSHPHVLQGIERRGEAVIAYSLGNFVFTNRTPEKRMTGVLEATVRLARGAPALAEVAFVPAMIDVATFAPAPATGKARAAVVARMTTLSAALGAHLDDRGGRLLLR